MMCSHIDQVKLQCRFLVAGFDKEGEAHIFLVMNPGYSEVKDTPGYFAIGNGDYAAMSTLGYFRQNVTRSVAETHYNVWAAKFMAQQGASEVGEKSFGFQMDTNGPVPYSTDIDFKVMTTVWEAWDSEGKPSMPEGIIQKINRILKGKKKRPSKKKAAATN